MRTRGRGQGLKPAGTRLRRLPGGGVLVTSPTCLDKARLVTGLRTALSTLPVASVPPHPLPIPEGGGESGREEGGSGRLVFIKAAGPALPARPRRPDPLRCPPPHVTAPTTSSTAKARRQGFRTWRSWEPREPEVGSAARSLGSSDSRPRRPQATPQECACSRSHGNVLAAPALRRGKGEVAVGAGGLIPGRSRPVTRRLHEGTEKVPLLSPAAPNPPSVRGHVA
ncbi:unnamed protein product [Rangifer tarandus platyrhynchus]|uniref:Uncharacterized protein n=1 Tax=Rangifer tarandus platyrhynchus TaxID=3082113 RepID=A0AC59YA94_RANTA